ncbi:MAG: hypothetical protein ABW184_17020 [Sphingobium sp.]
MIRRLTSWWETQAPDGPAPGQWRAGRWLAGGQAVFVLAAMMGLVVAPPVSGEMLLIPTGAKGRDALAGIAIGAGARLVGAGPLSESLVVSGDRAALMEALMPGQALVLRAGWRGCGYGDGAGNTDRNEQ